MRVTTAKIMVSLYLAFCTTLAGPSAQAYELTTHAAMTQKAYQRSNLVEDPDLLRNLGIDSIAQPFGSRFLYLDFPSAGSALPRTYYSFEGTIITEDLNVDELSIPAWLMSGAIREDDYPRGDNPQDDPFNFQLYRPVHHFFDPFNEQGQWGQAWLIA
jgi:hypothetical protein